MLRAIDASLSDEFVLGIMRTSGHIRNARRMGTSTTVRGEFESPRLPKYAYVGLLRHEILLFVDRPLHCRHCGRFGYVSASAPVVPQK